MNSCVVSLGSNIEPEMNMARALERLSGEFMLKARSSVLRTAPLGIGGQPTDQPDFLNGVVWLETEMDLEPLRQRLKQLEAALGRQPRLDKWGPREIDLDVIIFNGAVVDKDYFERDFLRQLTAEIAVDIKMRCY